MIERRTIEPAQEHSVKDRLNDILKWPPERLKFRLPLGLWRTAKVMERAGAEPKGLAAPENFSARSIPLVVLNGAELVRSAFEQTCLLAHRAIDKSVVIMWVQL